MATQTLTVKVDIDSSGAVTGSRVVGRSLSDIEQRANNTGRALSSAKTSLLGLFASVGVVQLTRQLAHMADEYANIGARLRLASDNTVSFAEAQRRVLTVAQTTGSSLGTTADLVGKLATSFRSLGGDAKQSFDVAVDLSNTISKAVSLSGASASAAQAALTQLGQGLASGTLRGDELNSVLEQTPRLAQAIAEGMGITVGQLRALGAQGKITAKQIVEALDSQRDRINQEFSQLPLTIGRAWTKLQNSVLSYVGTADQAGSVSQRVAEQIANIADHIDDIVRAVKLLGEIVATVYAAKMIRSGLAWIANLRLQTAAVVAQETAVAGLGVKTAASLGFAGKAATASLVAQAGWWATTKASMGAAIKSVGLLGVGFNVLFSAITGWQIGSYLREQFSEVRVAADAFIGGVLKGWEHIKYGAGVAWLAIKHGFTDVIDGIRSGIAGVINLWGQALQKMASLPGMNKQFAAAAASQLSSWATSIAPQGGKTFQQEMAELSAGHAEAVKQIDAIITDMVTYDMTAKQAGDTTKATTTNVKEFAGGLNDANAAQKNATASLQKYLKAMQDARAALAEAVSGYTQKSAPPDMQAWHDYEDVLRKVAEAAGKQIELAREQVAAARAEAASTVQLSLAATKRVDQINAENKSSKQNTAATQAATQAKTAHLAVARAETNVREKNANLLKVTADAQHQVTDAIAAMQPTLERNLALAREKMDVAGRTIQQMQQETMLAGLSERDAAIMRAGLDIENQLRSDNLDLTQQQIDAEKDRVMAAAATAYDEQKALEARKQAVQDFVGYWRNALDSVSKGFADLLTGGIRSFRDFGRTLGDIARQFVADIIAQFLRMRVLGPIFNSILASVGGWFGYSGASLGSTVMGIAGNYYGGGGTISSQGGVGGAGGGGVAGYLQTGGMLYKGYNALFGGGSAGTSLGGGTGGSFNSLTGTGVYEGPGAVLNPGYYGNGVSPFGGVGSLGGYSVPYASVGGGLLGAYYGYNHAGGGLGGVAAGVSYGALGAGIAGTAAGVAGGASLGAAAGGAFGAAAGMSWIPVVGWILAALAVVDAVSGGKLFGTAYKPTAAETDLSIGPGGGSAYQQYTEVKQKALFGGRKWRTTSVTPTQEVLDAANKLYEATSRAMVQGAQQLGVDVPPMITATLKTAMTLDKHGKVTGTDYVVEYLGRTWKEATADAAAKRIGAEAIVATVAASAGEVAQQLAEQWRGSADTLLDGAQMMLAAQSDINKGNALLALGSDQTLSAVTKLVQRMQADGETLAQTYAKLAQANQQYLDFVAQFNDQIQGAGLAVSLAKIAQQMQANINQANALAQAAGLQGARESDLANIHKVAAQQAADAMRQFAAAADQLATKLYATAGHTLAAVMQQIDTLQGKIKGSIDLALGDLSPLTDQQKLDLALKGLRSGTTSADQVLSLGRKMYATGSDYTGLYNKVQEILGQPSAGTSSGLADINTSLDQLNVLTQRRDHMVDLGNQAQRLTDAQTLAGYVADLSTVSGQTYQQVADSLGFSLSNLAKDLGVQDMQAYLQNLTDQDIPGSLGQASNEIVTAIQAIGRDIVAAIVGGPVTTKGPTPGITARGTATDDTNSLLASIDQKLDNIQGHTGDTAQTNRTLANQGNVDTLRLNQGVGRTARMGA